MPHFVRLTYTRSRNPVVVNLDHVTSMGLGDECTMLMFNETADENSQYIEVRETPEAILAMPPIRPGAIQEDE